MNATKNKKKGSIMVEVMLAIVIAAYALSSLFSYMSHLMQTTFKTIAFSNDIEDTYLVYSFYAPLNKKNKLQGKDAETIFKNRFCVEPLSSSSRVLNSHNSFQAVYYNKKPYQIIYSPKQKSK